VPFILTGYLLRSCRLQLQVPLHWTGDRVHQSGLLPFHSQQEYSMGKSLVEMTTEIIQSQISGSDMNTDEIKIALQETFNTLKALQEAELSGQDSAEKQTEPLMNPNRSIQKNQIICLECGMGFKMLTKHLKSHGITAKEYRKKYGFTSRQSLCARALSEERSKASKKRGIPENLRKTYGNRGKKKKK
jgi:predicted transcriptional regulator